MLMRSLRILIGLKRRRGRPRSGADRAGTGRWPVVVFDQPPAVMGRVLIPLRGVFERLGTSVQWNPQTNGVTTQRGDTQVQLTLGSLMRWSMDVP